MDPTRSSIPQKKVLLSARQVDEHCRRGDFVTAYVAACETRERVMGVNFKCSTKYRLAVSLWDHEHRAWFFIDPATIRVNKG